MSQEFVWMEHPALGPDRKQRVPRKAFDAAWSKSGWEETEAPVAEKKSPTEEVSQILEDIGYADGELTEEE